jgi:hypothetical protein
MYTDKDTLNYAPLYKELFTKLPESPRILEVGVYCGDSLRMWKEWFPESVICGVEKYTEFKQLWPHDIPVVVTDQCDQALAARVLFYSNDGYDMVIDDASHFGMLSAETFRLLWPVVRPGGWYVLEDWTVGLPVSPHYPNFGGISMLQLAQEFITNLRPSTSIHDMGKHVEEAGDVDSVVELRYIYGMACIKKQGIHES